MPICATPTGRCRPSSTAGRCCSSSSRAAWRRSRSPSRAISATWSSLPLADSAVAVAVLALLTADQLPRRPLGQQRPERPDGAEDRRDRRAGRRAAAGSPRSRCAARRRHSAGSSSRSRRSARRMTPVMFSYGGWQTSSFVAGEMRDPQRDLARGLLLGVAGVILLYTAVAFVCVHALGPAGLAGAETPATRRDAARARRQRRDLHRARHRDLGARLPQPGHADRAARLFRHGRGRPVLPHASPRSARRPACRSSRSSSRASRRP